jgi:hypothetical protein
MFSRRRGVSALMEQAHLRCLPAQTPMERIDDEVWFIVCDVGDVRLRAARGDAG